MNNRALAEYIRCFTSKTIHGSCEDYQAAASIDLDHDEADHRAGRKVAAPMLVLWGDRSHTGRFYREDVLSAWREAATDVTGGAIEQRPLPCRRGAKCGRRSISTILHLAITCPASAAHPRLSANPTLGTEDGVPVK
jgi:hypothetical protein